MDWRQIVILYAEAFRKEKVGAPKLNDDQVFKDFATLRRDHPECTDTDVFLFMAKAFKDRYPTDRTAREKWKRAIRKLVEEGIARSLPKARALFAHAGKPWTRKVEDEECEKIRLAVIDGLLEGALRFKDRRDSCP
jgi:hypothetical protein